MRRPRGISSRIANGPHANTIRPCENMRVYIHLVGEIAEYMTSAAQRKVRDAMPNIPIAFVLRPGPINVNNALTKWEVKQLIDGPINKCHYIGAVYRQYVSSLTNKTQPYQGTRAVHKNPINYQNPNMFVFVGDTSTVVAAASCWVPPPTPIYTQNATIDYLCSARTCKGAGSTAVATVERVALAVGTKHVQLNQTFEADQFYTKMRYEYNTKTDLGRIKRLNRLLENHPSFR